MSDLRPTTRLRWVTRTDGPDTKWRVLQQWFAEDMPNYMRDQAKGEWRDVPVEEEK